MTAQVPDRLEVECQGLELGSLCMYGLIRGEDPSVNRGWGESHIKFSEVEALVKPNDDAPRMTSLYSGYVPKYRLTVSGNLFLESIAVLDGFVNVKPSFVEHLINKQVEGNFWIVLKPSFRALRTYIPFVDGKVITNIERWVFEPKQVSKPSAIALLRGLFGKSTSLLGEKF